MIFSNEIGKTSWFCVGHGFRFLAEYEAIGWNGVKRMKCKSDAIMAKILAVSVWRHERLKRTQQRGNQDLADAVDDDDELKRNEKEKEKKGLAIVPFHVRRFWLEVEWDVQKESAIKGQRWEVNDRPSNGARAPRAGRRNETTAGHSSASARPIAVVVVDQLASWFTATALPIMANPGNGFFFTIFFLFLFESTRPTKAKGKLDVTRFEMKSTRTFSWFLLGVTDVYWMILVFIEVLRAFMRFQCF